MGNGMERGGRARPSERRETRAARKAASDGHGRSPEKRRHLQANGGRRRERPFEAGYATVGYVHRPVQAFPVPRMPQIKRRTRVCHKRKKLSER